MRVLFFTQVDWAFGAIHNGLIKELYKNGIYASLLNWSISYRKEEFDLLSKTYDIFITQPDGILALESYDIPKEKIIAIAHAQWDILTANKKIPKDYYSQLKGFGVISEVLKKKCQQWDIIKVPKVVELGLHFDLFYSKPSNCLKTVGYGGAGEVRNFYGQEIKRPHLISKVLEKTPSLNIFRHKFYNHLCMPSYYKEIDSVIMTSIEEAGGLPMMECAAAGRLPIGTPVGFFEHNAPNGGGILAPIEENAFVDFVSETLNYYADNPKEFSEKCEQVQAYARDNYDWSKKIQPWIDLLSSDD